MYKFTYIDHQSGVGNCFSSYGSEVHSIMERYSKGELKLENLLDVFEWEFDAAVPEPFPQSAFCKNMRDLYYEQGVAFFKNFKGYSGVKILEVEKSFDYEFDDWIYTGVIDLILEDEDGKLILQDYKSKGAFKSKKEQAEYARQLYLYSLFVKEKYGKFPDILRFLMFRKNKTVDIPFKETECSEAIEWAKDTVKQIRNCWDFYPSCEEFFGKNLCNHREYCTNKI